GFWAGYSWQDNSEGAGAARPDRVTMKLDKPSYTGRRGQQRGGFWAGYSWQDNSEGAGAARPDRVTMKLDKPSY
ncbi:hypothetical protein C0U44_31800, partial [Klebsiella pneumoniae]